MTSPEQSRKALEWFERLIEARTEESSRQLVELQREDPDLATAVSALLAADSEPGLDAPFEPANDLPGVLGPSAGDRLGPYELTRVLGEGGMGTVWEAQRVEGGFEQRVAVKFLRHVVSDSRGQRRFRFECEVLGRLQHPTIARILDTGQTTAGTPYLVMEHVEGLRIDEYCDQRALSVRERVRLVVKICGAVAHAHRNLVVHRDIKPGNILVTDEGEPRLLDFGIAKLLDSDREQAALTVEGLGPMTLEYASPEQVQGMPVTTASDVYSLGALLYQLLTGQTPFGDSASSPLDLGRSVVEEDARPPSSTLTRAALARDAVDGRAVLEARDVATSDQLRRELRGDLDNIALKALQREPERRYPSVDALAADLRNWLTGFPVEARGDSLAYRSAKFVRRNWLILTAAALVFAALAIGMGVATWKANEARKQRARADDHAQRTEMVNAFLVDLLAAPGGRWWRDLEHTGPETRVIDVIDEAAARLEHELDAAPLQRATLHQTLNDTYLALGLPDRAEHQVRRALEIRRRELGEIDPAVAESTYYLAATLKSQERYHEALETYRAALDIEERLPTPTRNIPYALSEAATTAARIGLHSDFEDLIQEALLWAREFEPRIEGLLLSMRAAYRAERGAFELAEEGVREAQSWFGSTKMDTGLLRRIAQRDWAAVAWLGGDLEEALERIQDPSSSRASRLRAQVLFDRRRFEESRSLLEDPENAASRSAESQVLSGRLALALDGNSERCLSLVEPALVAEESWSKGPTWYLAEARSAMAACLQARGQPGDEAKASELAESARATLEALFNQETPLHRRTILKTSNRLEPDHE